MTDETLGTENEAAVTSVPKPLADLQLQAQSAGLRSDTTDGYDTDADADSVWLRVEYPSGREVRRVTYAPQDAVFLEGIDLASVRFLPDLLAIVNTLTGDIEAQVRTRNMTTNLRRIPGFEELESVENDGEEPAEETPFFRRVRNWRLCVERDGVKLELGTASDYFRAVRGISRRSNVVTLKLSGLEHEKTDATAESLRKLSDSFFFDLDVRYGAVIELVAGWSRTNRIRLRPDSVTRPADFPVNRYPSQPIGLYRYGRSAQGLPLLSFLAFYQVLEYFFPIFTQDEVTRKVQQTIRNPLFDASDNLSIVRLVEAMRPTIKFGMSEREQLRAAIRRCLDGDSILRYINSSEMAKDHFCNKKQAVAGLLPLRMGSSNADIRDQVADRIYDIRCRIVHTKSDGGEGGVELLMPTGPEARSLAPDIELVRLAAQEAIIAGASPLDLK
ncbi:hypothetical protein GCM10027020_20890 [Nocardioides salsibiostraticola]